ncbi:MAG: hypothetical protein HEQ20_11150 [Aphanizomenon flos-aquae KM1D3_PB]|uniref:hypothetical protein n=1 Tax=Aphanizomenon flos-aquae TaxID=1176 RepID=UPI000B1EFDF6|nr:hypothetical protein [Aphanizomenon flos-aquae]QSV69370.1 MAG: hypothetical protein HEQ20_11150 [Aphanizomenon flos-aquae KM1D3_PB]
MKRVWAILLFFTQIGFIVFTYLCIGEQIKKILQTGNKKLAQKAITSPILLR